MGYMRRTIVVLDWAAGDEDETEAAFAAAAHHVSLETVQNRIVANSMETRNAHRPLRRGDGELHALYGLAGCGRSARSDRAAVL